MLKGKSNPWLSCPRFPLPIPSRGKFRKHWGPRLNQKQILQKNPRRGQRSQYLKLSHQHQLLFQEKKRSKKATKRYMDSSSSSNNSSASSLPDPSEHRVKCTQCESWVEKYEMRQHKRGHQTDVTTSPSVTRSFQPSRRAKKNSHQMPDFVYY